MQESRLFKIVYHLLDKGHATAPELADRFEVSVRTIYRDIDALSAAGIPVYAEAGRNGGIHLMSEYVMDKAVLSEEEKQEILAALQSLNATQSVEGSHVLSKLAAIFHVEQDNWLEVDFSRWGDSGNDNQKFNMLKSAIIHCRAVVITYASSCEEISSRKIYPLKLSYRSKAWYVKAYCTEKNADRLFKLARILDWELTDENFIRRDYQEVSDKSAKQECETIKLRFPREMAYRVYDEFDRTQVQIQENGELLATAQMPMDAWLIGYLLSFGTQVDVITPVTLREAVAEQVKEIYEKYKC